MNNIWHKDHILFPTILKQKVFILKLVFHYVMFVHHHCLNCKTNYLKMILFIIYWNTFDVMIWNICILLTDNMEFMFYFILFVCTCWSILCLPFPLPLPLSIFTVSLRSPFQDVWMCFWFACVAPTTPSTTLFCLMASLPVHRPSKLLVSPLFMKPNHEYLFTHPQNSRSTFH